MAAGFVVIDAEARNNAAVGAASTTEDAVAPAAGDILAVGLQAFVDSEADLAVVSSGTWALLWHEEDEEAGSLVIFRCLAPGSTGAIEWQATDTWTDTAYAWVRPTDLTYVGIAGNDHLSAPGDSLEVSLSTSSPAALLGICRTDDDVVTFAPDATNGFTELFDEGAGEVGSRCISGQYRLADASACVFDASEDGRLVAVVLEFSAAEGGGDASGVAGERGRNRGRRRGRDRGRVMHRQRMDFINGLWRPANLGLSFAGA